MKTKVVTGYVPLPILNMAPETFHLLGRQLVRACEDATVPIAVAEDCVENTWLYEWLETQGPVVSHTTPPADRFARPYDAILSHCVMHQKMEWMALAAIADPVPETFVWIDFGVMKQPDMTRRVITDFIRRVDETARLREIVAPGIREKTPVDDSQSWDRFCGSVVVVPRIHLFDLARCMKAVAMGQIQSTGKVTIESNTLAHVEWGNVLPFRWYQAWWGAPMFENYHG